MVVNTDGETIVLVSFGPLPGDVVLSGSLPSPIEVVADIESIDPTGHDVVLVDCRGNAPLGVTPTWQRSLTHLAPLSVVVIALVDEQSFIDDAVYESADNVVTLVEVALPTFAWRLRREVARQRAPFAVSPRWHPEGKVLETIADHASDWIFIKDLQHRFLLTSRSFATTVKLSREAIIGRNDLQIGSSERSVLGDPDSDWPGFWAQDDAVTQSGEIQVEDNPDWKLFSEAKRHKRTVRVPLRGARGEIFALLACASDVTRIKRAEDAVLRGQGLLDAESRARRAAENAATEKMNFLAAATHDLRQPLHAMGLFIESLHRRLVGAKELETLDKIRQSTTALSALFNALLDITRLDAALVTVDERHFPVAVLIDALRDEFVVEGRVKGLDVEFEHSTAFVRSDAALLGRILRNLLHNAVRYTDAGQIRLRTRVIDGDLDVRISDSGPGIPVAEHEAIFGEFYQIDRCATNAEHGLGLGLAIVKRTAELIGASLYLESAPDAGSTFSVRVPLGDPELADHRSTHPRASIASGTVVLVVDDEPTIRDGMADVFRANGCEVVLAAGVASAVKELDIRALSPDVVIADHRLESDETGATVIDAIRHRFHHAIPGLIVTGDTAPERLHEAQRSGFAFLHKPTTPADLIRVVAELLD